MSDFTGGEPLLDRPIAFHRCFMSVTTNCPVGALYLSQAWYWRDKGKDSDGWIYKSHIEFTKETGLTKFQQMRVRKALASKPWWEEKVKRVGTVPIFHYRIDRAGLLADIHAMNQLSESKESELSESKESELSSIYTENTKQRIQPEITRTNPERVRVRESSAGENAQLPDPEPCQDPRIPALSAKELASTNNPSGEGEFSGSGDIKQHHAVQNFQDRWNYSKDIAPITDELIRLYNIGKPDNWTGIVGDSRRARQKIQEMVRKYQGIGGKLAELPEMMKNALLFYRSSDFHTKKEFGSGDIFWLCEQERVEIAAAKWAGSGESVRKKVATAILEHENGVRHWEDGHVMSEIELSCQKRAIPKMRFDYPGLPPLEWVKKNMPDILKKLSPDYPEYPQKEELNYAHN